MRKIIKDGQLVALAFDGSFEPGTQPMTDPNLALQVIALKHPKGKTLVPHSHTPNPRSTERLIECLIVFSGRVRASVYHKNQLLEKIELTTGHGLMIIDGGVGYEILENATMMEFKNGPFLDDKLII